MATQPSRPLRSRTSSYVFVRNLVIGIGQGFQPVAGYNYSAGKRRRAWQAFWFSSLVGTVLCHGLRHRHGHFSRGRSCGGSAATRRSYALGAETLRFSCIVLPLLAVSTFVNQLYQCLGYPHGRDVPGKLQAGHFLPSGRAAPAAVAALRRCRDEPARGRPSDLRDLHAVPRSILRAPYPRAMQSKLNKKIRGEKPRIFFARFKYSIIMPDGKPFPHRANQLAHEDTNTGFLLLSSLYNMFDKPTIIIARTQIQSRRC